MLTRRAACRHWTSLAGVWGRAALHHSCADESYISTPGEGWSRENRFLKWSLPLFLAMREGVVATSTACMCSGHPHPRDAGPRETVGLAATRSVPQQRVRSRRARSSGNSLGREPKPAKSRVIDLTPASSRFSSSMQIDGRESDLSRTRLPGSLRQGSRQVHERVDRRRA